MPGSVCRIALATRFVSARARSSAAPSDGEPVVVGHLDVERRPGAAAAVAAASEATSVITSVSDTSCRLRARRRALHPGQLEQVVDQMRSSGPPCSRRWAEGRGTSVITPSSSPSDSARSPANGVRRSWDMKLTSSCRDVLGRALSRPGLGQGVACLVQLREHVGELLRELGRRPAGRPEHVRGLRRPVGQSSCPGPADRNPAPTCGRAPRRSGACTR